MNKLTINDIDLKNKKVLVRVDFNVPLDDNLNITDDIRITSSLPTIKKIISDGGMAILMSHLGRPKGKPNPKYSLKPAALRLSQLLGKEVKLAPDCIGNEVKAMVNAMKPGDVILLENLRFHEEEEKNNPEFAKQLADLGDVYVNDAFGSAHRAHASTEGLTKFSFPSRFIVQITSLELTASKRYFSSLSLNAFSTLIRPVISLVTDKICGKLLTRINEADIKAVITAPSFDRKTDSRL